MGEGWTIVSASPELFLARRGRRVWTAPIKGTRPLGDDDLQDSEKDAAEHVMIVDLERNDLSRVSEPGTVRWPGLMTEQELAGVKHLVTRVEGRVRDDVVNQPARHGDGVELEVGEDLRQLGRPTGLLLPHPGVQGRGAERQAEPLLVAAAVLLFAAGAPEQSCPRPRPRTRSPRMRSSRS